MKGRRIRLAVLLALLVMVTGIPLALLAANLLRTSWVHEREIIDEHNVAKARAIGVAVDQRVKRFEAALSVLANLSGTERLNPVAMRDAGLRLLPQLPGGHALLLVGLDGEVLVNSAVPPEETSSFVPTPWLDRTAQGRSVYTDLYQHPVSGDCVFAVAVPVRRAGRVVAALAAEVRCSSLGDLLRQQQVPEGGVVTVLDNQHRILARNRGEAEYVGRPPSVGLANAARRMSEGSWRGVLLEGTASYSALSHAPLTGWTVAVGYPSEVVDTPMRRRLLVIGLVGALLVAGGIGAAMALSGVVVRGMVSASRGATALARGEPLAMTPSPLSEVRDLQESLQRASEIVDQRTAERDQALAAAEALSRSKDEFVATLSHELRNPLNAMVGWLRLLREGELDEAERAHALEVVERNARIQAQLIDELLDMSQIIAGKLRLDMRRLDLRRVVETAVETVRPTAMAKEMVLTMELPESSLPVSGDADRLRQVAWNLLSNAIKFTPAQGQVSVLLEADGREAVLRVSDTGIGISQDFLPYVFERFRQADTLGHRARGGLGIGLALAQELVELHAGTLEAESPGEGRGATFTVRLPLAAETAVTTVDSQASSAALRHVLAGRNVLVVDDDPDTRRLVGTALRQAGAVVRTAGSAAEARRLVEAAVPDAVVSDVAMPEEDGYELARALRGPRARAAMALVALTAYSSDRDRERALEAGFHAHVGKPVDPLVLVRIIATTLADLPGQAGTAPREPR